MIQKYDEHTDAVFVLFRQKANSVSLAEFCGCYACKLPEELR
jgi:hypothetical protein